MAKGEQFVAGRWRIVETEMWDQDALDLVVPAHITFGRNGLGEMQLIAIGASIDYCVEERAGDAPVVEFSWSGFDEMDPSSGRGNARIDGDMMHGKLFIHQGDQSGFVAKRDRVGSRASRAHEPLQPTVTARTRGVRARPRVRRGRG